MNCEVCGDLGMLVLEWADAPYDFAICLCPAATWYRSNENAGRTVSAFGWQVWCAIYGVDQARVFKLEAVYSATELAAVGLSVQSQVAVSRAAALLAAGRGRRPKL